jgi:hypothetical protein
MRQYTAETPSTSSRFITVRSSLSFLETFCSLAYPARVVAAFGSGQLVHRHVQEYNLWLAGLIGYPDHRAVLVERKRIRRTKWREKIGVRGMESWKGEAAR